MAQENETLEQRKTRLADKIGWCNVVAEDAAKLYYWDICKFVRNAKNLAQVELRTLNSIDQSNP
jgi:hypothetical protein